MALGKVDWLPELIDVDPFSTDKYEDLYLYYLELQKNRPVFNGVAVYIPIEKDIIDSSKQGSFFHLTTKDYTSNQRKDKNHEAFDSERSKRIRWIKPVLENIEKDEVKVVHEENRCYVFLEEMRYIIILTKSSQYEKTGQYKLLTAYYLSEEWSFKKMQKKFK